MNFYLYINKNLLFDFLSRNLIAPDAIVKDISRNRTIATASDSFLFVTAQKLNRKSRERGIASTEFVCPITLELSNLQKEDGEAILVNQKDGVYSYSLGNLCDYDSQKHVGAYLIGEIPFSRVQRIYFDTLDDMKMFFRPSSDYWYPTEKYEILPDDFRDELSIVAEETKMLKECGKDARYVENVLSEIRVREKKRAALLNFVNATYQEQQDGYAFNIDACLRKLFGLSIEEINKALPHYKENQNSEENLELLIVNKMKSKVQNQCVFNQLAELFLDKPYNIDKQFGLIIDLLENFLASTSGKVNKDIEKIIKDIERFISDDFSKDFEEILASIKKIDVLKALMFVVKNPNDYDFFLRSLEVYHADLLTKRRASVLWGYLNALNGMPGKGFNKDNVLLWQFIEWKVLDKDAEVSLSVSKPAMNIVENKLLGITLNEEKIITIADIRKMILEMPKEKISSDWYEKILKVAEKNCGGKKKAEKKGYYFLEISDSLHVSKGDRFYGDKITDIAKLVDKLREDCKKLKIAKEKLFEDYIENEDGFETVFNADPLYWKDQLKVILENKNAKL